MTNSPNSGNGSDPAAHPRLRRYVRRISIALGALAILGGAAGVGLRIFIYQRLVPIVERSMTTVIQRPVRIGAVESFSLTHVRFGESSIPSTATDSDQVDMAGIRARFNPLEVVWRRRLTLDVTILNPDATIEQDADGRWIATTIAQPEPGWIEFKLDTLRLEDGRAELVPQVPQRDLEEASVDGEQEAAAPRFVIEPFQGEVTLRNNNRFVVFQLNGKTQGGGRFDVRGEADLEDDWRANVLAQLSQISLTEVSSLLPPLPIQIQDGVLGGNIGVNILSDRSFRLRGTAQFSEVAANIRNVPNQFTNGQGRLRFDGQRVELEDTTLRYGDIPVAAEGSVHLDDGFDITARVASVTADELFTTFGIERPVSVEGEFQADIRLMGALNQPQISGTATNRTPVLVDRIALADTEVQFSLTPQTFVLEALEVIPQTGGRITGSGRAQLGEDGDLAVDLQAQNLNGDAIAQRYGTIPAGYTLGSLAADIQIFGTFDTIQALVNWRAPQATFSGQGELLYANNVVRLRNTSLSVAGGTASASGQANLAQNRWQATVSGSQIQLSQFASNLTGVGGGELALAGRLDTLNPSQITADGQVTASQVPYLDESLTASIRWTGDRLEVLQARSSSLSASGTINTRPRPAGLPEITTLNLDVRLRNYELASEPLPFTPPTPVDLAGRVDFAGRLTGTLAMPQVAGRVQLGSLAVNDLVFESPLTGTLQFAANEGLALDVSGEQDRLAVVLDDDYRPVSFFVRQDTAIAQGRREGDRLLTSIENFPLEALNLEPAANLGLGELAGLATGRFDINIADLGNLSGTGEVAIAQPRLGYISGDVFRGQFRYANGGIILDGSELLIGDSRYVIFGSLIPVGTIQFRGQIVAEEGNIEDLLVALQYFELTDFVRLLAPPIYDRAADVETIPVDTPDQSLFDQLRRYSEILALYEEQVAEREEAALLPDLAELEGEFSGTINVEFSQQDGLLAEFDLQGEDWQWGEYAEPNQIIAQGSFDGNTLTFLPFRFVADDTLINFSGQVGGGVENSGQLLAENVSLALLRDLLRVPIDIEGNLNANAVLTGSIENPQARGEIILTNATINDNPIAEADSTFSYSGARLNVIATMLVEDEPEDEDDPLRLTASIPYQFPFMTVSPQSDNIILDVDIRNEGLALLNLVNRAIAWEGGQADVTLQVRGTLRQTPTGLDVRPLATGVAEFENGTFSAQVLPEPLTNVTGRVLFNRDRILVDTLQGQFSDGQVMAEGVIPIFLPLNVDDAEPPQPLTVTLADIELNLKGLYNGGVNGAIAINGTALAPQLTGEVILSDGRISLPDQAVASAATQTSFADFGGFVSPPQFNDLEITFGNNLLLTRAPILNFVASGNLFINGTLDDIRPAGTIRLRSGQVNVFTSQFNLDRTHTNIAEFIPNRGLDPILDIQLVTSVLEETRSPVVSTSPFTTSEIADISAFDFGEVQTVRVEASVMGPASELFSNIELRSSPPRSENEIIALLGGGFVDTLGRGDSALAIANLAGSALLTGLQTLLSNALGISDFRLFPTTVIDDDRERGSTDQATASLALAAELGFDITDDLSFSILQLLTVEEPTQFNIRYRLNDQFLLRGTTNFSDDTRAVLEYEIRF